MSERPVSPRRLRIFLCHSSGDKESVRNLYKKLLESGFQPWLDEIDILPGQYWKKEIPKGVRDSDIVLICLSRNSVTKKGYIQKEIKFALDVANEQPEGTIYLIPVKLEDCALPEKLLDWQWVNLYDENGFDRLICSLERCVKALGASKYFASATDVAPKISTHPSLKEERNPVNPSTKTQYVSQPDLNETDASSLKAEAMMGDDELAVPQNFTASPLAAEKASRGFESDRKLQINSKVTEYSTPAKSVLVSASDLKLFQVKHANTLEAVRGSEILESLSKAKAPVSKRRLLAFMIAGLIVVTALIIGAIWILRKTSVPDNNAAIRYNLGLTLANQQKYPEAEAEYREAIKLSPNNAAAHIGLGLALGSQGKHEAAEAEFMETIRIDPNNVLAYNNLGFALYKQRKYKEAEDKQRQALKIDPNYIQAHYNLGGALASQEKFDEAVGEFEEAIKLNPNHIGARNELGLVLLSQGKYEEAENTFRAAINLAPRYAPARNGLGMALNRQGKYAKAEIEYHEAINTDRNYAAPYCNLGYSLLSHGKNVEAEANLKEAQRLDPNYINDVDFHFNLGVALINQGKNTKAEEEFTAVIRLDPNNASAHYNLGVALGRQGRHPEAEISFREAVRLDPNHVFARNALSHLPDKSK